MLMEGVAGRFVQRLVGTATTRITGLGSLAVALVEGQFDESVRGGLKYRFGTVGVTGIAPVQAVPSTAAQWLLWNPNGNGVTQFIDELGMLLLSGTGGAGGTFFGANVPAKFAPTTVPVTNAATIVNQNPMSSKASQLIIISGATLQGIGVGAWTPLGFMNPAGTLVGQTQMENRAINGGIAIPPGTGYALAVVSPTGTTPLFAPYGSYREYATDME